MARDFFQEALARFRNIQYPTTAQRQFDTLRNDLRKDVLSKEFNEARAEYEDLLSGRGLNLTSIDATEGGQRQTIGINPITGATEITTPEYNRLFRTDKTDFNPGGRGAFENIYDAGLGNIDPRTGLPKDKDVSDDTDSGLITDTSSRGEREGRDKDQGARSNITHEVINGQAYRINTETGEVESLEGIDAMIANTLNAYVTNPYTLAGLLNNITGANKSYDEKMKDLKNVNEDAYNSLTQQVRENYRTQQFNEEEESFFDKITKGIFKDPDQEGKDQTSKETFGQADDDRQTYGASGQYGGNNNTSNSNTSSGVSDSQKQSGGSTGNSGGSTGGPIGGSIGDRRGYGKDGQGNF